VAARGVFFRCFYAVPFDRFDPDEDGEIGIGLRLLDGFFNREVNALKVVAFVDG
jgi:hypothetical protein